MEKQGEKKNKGSTRQTATGIQKVATQIEGLDDILRGGLPAGRTTLISGGPGTGKSVLGLEFLYRGAMSGNPGIFLTFEETTDNIRRNALTFGWDLASLERAGRFFLMEAHIDPHILLSGDFNMKGLLAIIEGKAREMGAGRIVIDAMDILMRLFNDPKRQQNEVFALNNWLREQRLTAVLTTKNVKAMDPSPEFGYLDYMADCVIYLDQRIREQVITKRLQVIKYRGSAFSGNEYPFLISDDGVHFNPITDIGMHYPSAPQRISSGNLSLDPILGGGYQIGTCILISGETGTGKTAIASTFARSACENGQKVLYVNYEESQEGMIAGMLSLGIDLRPAIRDSTLRIESAMPESMGIEEHLYHKIGIIRSFQPDHLVVDAISAVKRIAGESASFDFLMRLIHSCKKMGITVILINQARDAADRYEISGIGISSIIETIIILHFQDVGNETRRILEVRKSRGAKHSTRHHRFFLTGEGLQLDAVQPAMTRV